MAELRKSRSQKIWLDSLQALHGIAATAIVAALTPLTLINTSHLPRVLVNGIPAFLLFYAALALNDRVKIPGLLRLVGDASYSIYLIHLFFVQRVSVPIFRMVSVHLTAQWSVFVAAALIALVGICGGILTYWIVEQPLGWLFRRLLLPRKQMPSAGKSPPSPTVPVVKAAH